VQDKRSPATEYALTLKHARLRNEVSVATHTITGAYPRFYFLIFFFNVMS